MEKGLFIVCLLFVIQTVRSQSYNECFTPDDLNGVCINIKRCPSLLMLLENDRKNSSIAAFLRNSMCGYEGRDPKVCCALDNENTGSSTQRPQNTRPPVTVTTTERVSGLSSAGENFETVRSAYLPSQSTCGRSNSSHIRIVGGVPADLGAWPWMAALGYQNLNRPGSEYQWLCGGALISDRYVLTAAHCTVGIGNRRLAVVHLGDLDLNPNVQDSAAPINVPIMRIITHERYNAREYTNDIALLKLESTVRFNDLIQPICLPIKQKHRSNLLANLVPFVAGWGSTSFRGPSSSALMEVQVPVLHNADCKKSFENKKTVIDDRVLCAGLMTGGKDACQGDSGGPLMWPNGNQYYLVGVVSFGFKCAEPGFPGVYTRVTYFVDWIGNNINNSYN